MANLVRRIHTLVVGAGQAGLATSYFLTHQNIPHVVLDRSGIGSAWKYERWDSFTLVTPNWTIQLPGASYVGNEPNSFLPRDEFVAWLEDWATNFSCPVVSGVEVTGVGSGKGTFEVETSDGYWCSQNIVIATSTYQRPRRPSISDQIPSSIYQLDASNYRSPDSLKKGSVLIIGSGQTGCQIAEEINEAGYRTYLSTGKSGRLPRRYRGRDCLEWQLDMGFLDRTPDMLKSPADRFRSDPHVSGKAGGRTLSLHKFEREGITLLGHLEDVQGSCIYLKNDLNNNVLFSDIFANEFMQSVDEYIERGSLTVPAATQRELEGGPLNNSKNRAPVRWIDLFEHDIRTLIWSTGFSFNFEWIDFPVTDEFGYPITNMGATDTPGLYFCGLNWMSKRKSGIIFGVHDDAHVVAQQIARKI